MEVTGVKLQAISLRERTRPFPDGLQHCVQNVRMEQISSNDIPEMRVLQTKRAQQLNLSDLQHKREKSLLLLEL